MKHVKKSVLLWYSAREMYDLVVGVEDYPLFLPWCEKATVIERHGPTADGASTDGMTARLGLHYAGVRHAFTTRNEHVAGRSVKLTLVDGPFSLLEGSWAFHPLGQSGITDPESTTPTACRVEFELSYAFSNRPLELLLSPVFERIANTFVDSFVQRAGQVHGER